MKTSRAAIHEAGHAVSGALLPRVGFEFVLVGPENSVDVEYDEKSYWSCCDMICLLYAGYFAEKLFSREYDVQGSTSDFRYIGRVVRQRPSINKKRRLRLRAKAEKMVRDNEAYIRRVAAALDYHKRLTVYEVLSLRSKL